jgi:hypothetical protein
VADDEQPNLPAKRDPEPVWDPEQQRQFEQYQQFEQFQRFLRFQEAQGQLPPGQTQPPAGQQPQGLPPALPPQQPQGPKPRPTWLKILLSKGFRRLVLLGLVIFAVVYGCNTVADYLNPGRKDDGLGVQGGGGPGRQSDPGREPGRPNEVLYTLYQNISLGAAPQACYLFNKEGAAQFAADYGAPDCEAAVRKLQPEVRLLNRVPRIDAKPGQTVLVNSCDLDVKAGSTSLGTFTFSPLGNAWIISGHQLNECPKPTATTSSPTSTTRPSN